MKRMISAFLILILCMSIVPWVAAATETAFVVDEFGYLADEELAAMNRLAENLCAERGVGIFFVYTQADSLQDYDIATVVGNMEDYFVMMENQSKWYTFQSGTAESLDADTVDALRGVYDEADTYVGGVEDFLYATAEYFPCIAHTPETTEPQIYTNVLFDEADLLTPAKEAELTAKLVDIGGKYNAQIVIATISAMENGDIDHFVEYLYDSMQFGYGANRDGVLLLVCMDPREYRILSNGFAADAIQMDDIDRIGESIVSDLSIGFYGDAFETFAQECEYYLSGHLNGFVFNVTENLAVALLIGLVIGIVTALILKGQLKTVRKQYQANDYVKTGSMQVSTCHDIFLYRDVRRTKKETPKSSGSGSGSRSGSSRNVGGGSF